MISYVGGASQPGSHNGNNITIPVSSIPMRIGDTLVMSFGSQPSFQPAPSFVDSVTDDVGNTYTQMAGGSGVLIHNEIWVCQSLAAIPSNIVIASQGCIESAAAVDVYRGVGVIRAFGGYESVGTVVRADTGVEGTFWMFMAFDYVVPKRDIPASASGISPVAIRESIASSLTGGQVVLGTADTSAPEHGVSISVTLSKSETWNASILDMFAA